MADVKQINLNGTAYTIQDPTARSTANNALSTANSAQTAAGQAKTAADDAQTAAGQAKTAADAAQGDATLALSGAWNITYTSASMELKFTKVEAG